MLLPVLAARLLLLLLLVIVVLLLPPCELELGKVYCALWLRGLGGWESKPPVVVVGRFGEEDDLVVRWCVVWLL